jgi:two-component system response regulator ResD
MEKKLRILMIEDDALLRSFYAEILGKENFEVIQAQDGEEGLKCILEGGFDLILLDVILPKKDGLEVLREAQNQTPKQANGPIVIISNLGQEDVVKQCLRMGASGFLIKSMHSPKDVLQEVKNFLDHRREWQN